MQFSDLKDTVTSEKPFWYESPESQKKGYWLSIKPNPSAWANIQKIQKVVGEKLREEGITTWAPYPYELSHITVFLGFSDEVSTKEKLRLMKKVSQKISELPKFEINFNLKEATLKRGPGAFITLQFSSPEVKVINEKVREALKELILDKKFDRAHLYQNYKGNDHLDSDIQPHFTLGILDIDDSPQVEWKNKHRDLKSFVCKEKVERFEEYFTKYKNKLFNGLKCQFPVVDIELLGLDKNNTRVNEKVHHTIASCSLNGDDQKLIGDFQKITLDTTQNISKEETIDYKNTLLFKVFDLVGAVRLIEFELDTDEKFQKLINIGFDEKDCASKFLSKINSTGKVWKKGNMYWVRLGLKRCQKLFGADLGKKIYETGISDLSKYNTPIQHY